MPNRKNFKRQANKPRRVARSATVQSQRILRGISKIFLQSDNVQQGGVAGFYGYTNSVGELPGHEFIKNNFEQYRVRRVKILMKPSTAFLNGGSPPSNTQESIIYQNSVYSLMNGTEVESFIDYDSTIAPGNYNELLTRPNLKVKALKPNNWTMIADYEPRSMTNPSFTSSSPTITWSPMVWMSTENMDTPLRGLRGRVTNRAQVFNTQDNVVAVDVMITFSVQMRGPKNGLGVTSVLGDMPVSQPRPSSEEDFEIVSLDDEDKDVPKARGGADTL